MKKLVQQKILYFKGLSATLFLHSRTIRSHIFMKIGDNISLALEFTGIKRYTACSLRPDPGSMVNIIRTKALFYQLFGC